ncbi:hypothetical protein TNCV_1571861 [Trichonephila clavipes]|uniref:Uncharacterized protein n=1 Tax=Trichonephila clavipes TaxID=2585209 RepID=A0A8X6SQ41_TRICX|nr:hypothetical protein TNCV_1571861 [Trichonephila clavipes]
MFTVPSIQSESSLSALNQAKNPKQPSTQMKNHSHASRIPSFDQSPSCHSAECKPPLSPCPHKDLSYGIEDCFTVQMPKKERLFRHTRIKP